MAYPWNALAAQARTISFALNIKQITLRGASALLLGVAGLGLAPAQAGCLTSGNTVTCTGDLASGTHYTDPINTLTLNALTTAIAPANGITGASLIANPYNGHNGDSGSGIVGDGDRGEDGGLGGFVTLNYDGGAQSLTTVSANGIVGISYGGSGGSGGGGYGVKGDGGDGGNGATGGNVTITGVSGSIATTGVKANGILALSAGGNGGDGGDAGGIKASAGDGGNAAGGGDVIVTSSATIDTYGNDSSGIVAQSTGGHGGSGGSSSGVWSDSGGGGRTAPGGTVTVTNDGAIHTRGTFAFGIYAQSIGGFGGNGGSGGGLVSYGGSGASAGPGGVVSVIDEGTIITERAGADAIFAQSVGGGGGNGGSAGGLVGLGAGGNVGGAGGKVYVTTDGTGYIRTLGDKAIGILAQSVGGGGGDGGDSIGLAAFGGGGSATSNGDAVTVNNSVAITTQGTFAQAIFAQSIGGGGGNGGTSAGLVSFGGSGGSGGDAGTVDVLNSGALGTFGNDSSALFAQSIGGGGGNGGNAYAASPSISLAMGGDGAAGGIGKAVTINGLLDLDDGPSTTIVTTGDRSHGIQAQSIGGGGGNGGLAVAVSIGTGFSGSVALGGNGGGGGASGAVLVNERGLIATSGQQAYGIFAQSIGGGGGNGGGAVSVALSNGFYSLGLAMGGTGGAGGNADTVTVNGRGTISTIGDQSYGVFAQSIGGGGGNGGFAVAATSGSLNASVSLGGSGDHGGNGADVLVDMAPITPSDAIVTVGAGSSAIFAQSVGGGGGNGGFAVSGSLGGGSVGIGLGGKGKGGGDGAAVTVTNATTLATYGATADGIFAQSVGGGGGDGGFAAAATGGIVAVSVAVGGSAGSGGAGDKVLVDNSGAITTTGDLAYGIFAESVGGGGGDGGMALSGSLAVQVGDVPLGAAASISIGGVAGAGGKGDAVTVANTGDITTTGLGSHAIFAESVGGGGGTGGIAGSVAMTLGTGASFGLAVGGHGGQGSDASDVVVNNTASSLFTVKDGADGIFAQSVGGGGGDGGFAFSGALGFDGEQNVNVSVAVGGFGSGGGKGGNVTVTSSSVIATEGDNSYGIQAQSVGGGGGNGGLAVTGTLGLSETPGDVGVSVGGFAGNGGTAGNVSVTNNGYISTTGYDAIGILAQSTGGSGGNGGLSMTVQLTGATKNSAAIGVAIGGGGGNGNAAGTVNVLNDTDGTIITSGFGAHGIEAQSVGGGGGNGGLALLAEVGKAGGSEDEASKTLNVGVTIGGAGGNGGTGGNVLVTNKNNIAALGDTASGIYAQSIGGGGGYGGGAIDTVGLLSDTSNNDSRTVNMTVAVGGGGGSGNDAGTVTVDNDGIIVTSGKGGYGIFAQSVGGGGGAGGRADTLDMTVIPNCKIPDACEQEKPETKNNLQLAVTVGGSGGGSGDGNVVTIHNTGLIATYGESSDGIFAQSVGGGGGSGGEGTPNDEALIPSQAEDVLSLTTSGAVSSYKNLQFAVGGCGGSSGNGGLVAIDDTGSITTNGAYSNGVFAQSVGGGGGVGGTATIGTSGLLGIGGTGGAAGNGGDVTVTADGTSSIIETYGIASDGIFAQSVGGGGGIAGNVDRGLQTAHTILPGVTTPTNLGIGLALGLGGGNGGDGGHVSVSLMNRDWIITHGDGSAAIFAQSVGGGGGELGELGNDLPVLSLLSWHIGSNGDAGNGGQVDVAVDGAIKTAGNSATGVFAQSAGGQGIGGAVNVTVQGSILTGAILGTDDGTASNPLRGLGSAAIIAQSVGNTGNGDITVDIEGAGSVVQGGRTQLLDATTGYVGIGIWVIDGNNNSIINHGLVTTLGGVNQGYSILASGSGANTILPGFKAQLGGNDTVQNYGTVTGSFDLGGGHNTFINEAGGTLNAGAYASVGNAAGFANLLDNSGTILPGGASNVFTTQVMGNWKQSATGHYGVDLDLYQTDAAGLSILGKTADRINVGGTGTDGGNAALSGTVDIVVLNPGDAQPGHHTVTIVYADSGVTTASLRLSAPPSAVATYALTYPDARSVNVDFSIDFAPAGLNRNEAALGNHINQIQLALPRPGQTGAAAATVMTPLTAALFNLPDLGQYAAAIDELLPQVLTANSISTEFSSQQFSDSLLSCHMAEGEGKFVAEGTCVWLRGNVRGYHNSATAQYLKENENEGGVEGGMQTKVAPQIEIGLAASYDGGGARTGNEDYSRSQRLQIGASLKAQIDDITLALTASGGHGHYNIDRRIAFPGYTADAAGAQLVDFVTAHLRGAYTFDFGNNYLRPRLDLGMTHLMYGAYSETGTASATFSAPGQEHTFVSLQPAMEFGTQFELGGSFVLRPYGSVGLLQFANGGAADYTLAFTNAPVAAGMFKIKGPMQDTMFDSSIGLELFKPDGATVQLGGSLQTSGQVTASGGWLKVAIPF